MKKNYTMVCAVIAALIALCAFWGCSSSDDDDGPSLPHAEEAFLGTGEITAVTVADDKPACIANGTPYTPTGNADVTVRHDEYLGSSYAAAVTSAGSKITSSGKVTLKLPAYNTYWSEYTGDSLAERLTANPPDVKTAAVNNFKFSDSGSDFRLDNNNATGGGRVIYMYADKDAIIKGVYEDDGVTLYVNLILKKGWNSVIESWSGSNPDSATQATGIPGAGYRWEVSDDH